ncbi:MAG: hypothetical protein AB7F89_07155 [Pirellulaceae bacterium]
MKSIATSVLFALFVLVMSQADAQEMPSHVLETLNRVVGKWTMERVVAGKKSSSVFELEWAIPETVLLFKWRGTDALTGHESSSMGVLGWDPIKQLVVEHEIGSGGFTADCTHIITPDGKWISPGSGTAILQGKPVHHQGHRIFTIVSNDEWTVTSVDSVVDGKLQAEDISTLTRQK